LKTSISIWAIIVPLLLLGCGGDKKEVLNPSDDVGGVDDFAVEAFPLKVGNRWEYKGQAKREMLNLEGEPLPIEDVDITEFFSFEAEADITIEVIEEGVVLDKQAFKIKTVQNHKLKLGIGTEIEEGTSESSDWFTMSGDTLLLIRGEGGWTRHEISYGIVLKPLVQENPLLIYQSMPFPLEVGQSWIWFQPESDNTCNIPQTRTVEAKEMVSIPAGTFDAFRLHITPLNPCIDYVGHVTQWFSDIGLLKMQSISQSEIKATDERGELLFSGMDIWTTSMELVSFSVDTD
jgi:hypothetical protein